MSMMYSNVYTVHSDSWYDKCKTKLSQKDRPGGLHEAFNHNHVRQNITCVKLITIPTAPNLN